MMSYREGRKCIIKVVEKYHQRRGEFTFPPKEAFDGEKEPDEIWQVLMTVQEGTLPDTTHRKIFYSEHQADHYINKHPIGSELPTTLLSQVSNAMSFDDWVNFGLFPIRGGDEELYLPWQVMKDAGLIDENGTRSSMDVLRYLGEDRTRILEEKYGENWSAAAEFEYCLAELPNSSPAFIAAACRFHYFVLENDFKAGYLLRDLEVLVHGIEAEALKARETRRKAGLSGSKKSAEAREKRRADLLEKMELIASRNVDAVRFGEDAFSQVALKECIKDDEALWTQGAGQVAEYLGEIRRGEAGPDMEKRYRALFGS